MMDSRERNLLLRTFCVVACLALLFVGLRAAEALTPMIDAGRAHGFYTSGIVHVLADEPGDAAVEFEAAARLKPALARAHFHLGDLAFKRGNLTAAQQHYRRSLEIEPEFVFAHFNLACALSSSGDTAGALQEVEALLKLGYGRWDKLQSDTDLAAVRTKPEFSALIATYQAEPVTPSRVVAFHLADLEGKRALLEAASDSGPESWRPLAALAFLESEYSLRRTAVQMHRYFDANGSQEAFVRGLYDSNGYVCKAAGNALASVGTSALPAIEAVLASGDANAIFYARQIKSLILKNQSPGATNP